MIARLPFLRLACMMLLVACAASPRAALAAVGMRFLPANEQTGSMALWYPSTAAETAREFGPFTIAAAWNAEPARGNGRLIVLSHGSTGSPLPEHDLARALVQAGFIVASPEHEGDNWRDDSAMGPRSWMRRPHEVAATIDRLAADASVGPLFDAQRVGVYGMSAGGLTALAVAGARWSLARMSRHCQDHAHDDPGFCTYGERGAWYRVAQRRVAAWFAQRSGSDTSLHGHAVARVRAAVAAVPVGAVIEPASLADIAIPVGLVVATEDRILAPALHVNAVQAACPRCRTLAVLDGAGHDSVMSPWPAVIAQKARLSGPESAAFDSARLPDLYRTIAQFFAQHL
jgi:predicted dienelactone hydrolase